MTLVNAVNSEEAFERLSGLFAALGFEPGRGWEDTEGKGAAFLAPVGNLELVTGRLPGVPPVLVEVTQLDAVHGAVRQWLGDSGLELSEVAGTHWNSRMFTVELAEGLRLGFWESENPAGRRP